MRGTGLLFCWFAGCWLMLSAGRASAQPPGQGSGGSSGGADCRPALTACATCRPARVVVHVPPPEVVYEEAPEDGRCKEARPHFLRCRRAAAPAAATSAVTVSSILTPMTLAATGGFLGQTLDTGLGLHTLGLNGLSAPSFDGSEMRAAQELELIAVRLAAVRAAREAEVRATSAHMQRVQTHLTSVLQGITASTTTRAQGVGELTMQQLHQEIQDVKTRMEQLNAKIEEVANRCNRLCRPSAPAATNERLAEVKRAYEEYGQAVDVFVKSSTSENHARLQAAKKKLADLDEQ